MGSNLYLGLVHYPIYDKRREIVATAVTNFDLHDIARCARTYAIEGVFIITPLESQIELVKRIIQHWVQGPGAAYNPTRRECLDLIRISRTIDEADCEISKDWGERVRRVATGASAHPRNIGFEPMQSLLGNRRVPFLMLFGTGWGLTQEVRDGADYVLAPIQGGGYNHLSVRSAVAIILDRLLGERLSSNQRQAAETWSVRDAYLDDIGGKVQ